MYACTGASPSAFAICGLPPERSFTGLASLAPGLAFVPAFAVFMASAVGLRAPLARDARLAFGFALLSVIIRPFLLAQVTEFGEKKRYFRAGLRRKSFATNTRFGKPACSEDLPPCQVASRFAIVALSPWRKG
jgi:hypothetical protein